MTHTNIASVLLIVGVAISGRLQRDPPACLAHRWTNESPAGTEAASMVAVRRSGGSGGSAVARWRWRRPRGAARYGWSAGTATVSDGSSGDTGSDLHAEARQEPRLRVCPPPGYRSTKVDHSVCMGCSPRRQLPARLHSRLSSRPGELRSWEARILPPHVQGSGARRIPIGHGYSVVPGSGRLPVPEQRVSPRLASRRHHCVAGHPDARAEVRAPTRAAFRRGHRPAPAPPPTFRCA